MGLFDRDFYWAKVSVEESIDIYLINAILNAIINAILTFIGFS